MQNRVIADNRTSKATMARHWRVCLLRLFSYMERRLKMRCGRYLFLDGEVFQYELAQM